MRRWVVTALVLAIGSAADASPYFAHPHSSFETMEKQRAMFLATEALHRISMAYDSVDDVKRAEIRATLAADPTVIELLGLQTDCFSKAERKIKTSLAIWKQSYPSIAADAGDAAQLCWDNSKILGFAHSLTRLAYDLAGLAQPKRVIDIVYDTVYGPSAMYQSNRIVSLRASMLALCESRTTALDEQTGMPREFKWLRKAVKYSPDMAKHFAEGFLGKGKSCESLVRDIMDIVGPHHSPLKSSSKREGQLEGLSIHLARVFFQNAADLSNPIMLRRLRQLEKLSQLDPQKTEGSAVASVFEGSISPLALVRFMALASHNHSLELYIQKAALQLIADPAVAVATAQEIFQGLNHFYGLLDRHRSERKSVAAQDMLATSARPYHYWGGALVSCELLGRGYEQWVATLVSGMLGKVYEGWTGSNGEGISGKAEDINLHIAGALEWASVCQ